MSPGLLLVLLAGAGVAMLAFAPACSATIPVRPDPGPDRPVGAQTWRPQRRRARA